MVITFFTDGKRNERLVGYFERRQSMNIFYLDRNPKIAAQMHCDKHVVKMILESAQMLCTAHRVLGGERYADETGLYKNAHKNHPSTIWTRSSDKNYMWLYQLMVHLMEEYTYRYGKHHATERLIEPLRVLPHLIEKTNFNDPPQCMPAYCKGSDTVSAYQTYYILEKSRFAKWTKRPTPQFFIEKKDDQRTLLGVHGSET